MEADAEDTADWSWALAGGEAGVGEVAGSWVSMSAHGRFVLDPASGDFAYEPRAEAVDALRGEDVVVERFLVTAGNRAGITERGWEVVLKGADDSPTALLVEGEPVPEDAAEGTVLLRLSALDPDRDERFVFSLVSGEDEQPEGGAVDPRVEISGQVLRVASGGRLDHDTWPAQQIDHAPVLHGLVGQGLNLVADSQELFDQWLADAGGCGLWCLVSRQIDPELDLAPSHDARKGLPKAGF